MSIVRAKVISLDVYARVIICVTAFPVPVNIIGKSLYDFKIGVIKW